jgi:hypothetical protein
MASPRPVVVHGFYSLPALVNPACLMMVSVMLRLSMP